ncbi:PorP/SprF family type IX secretion system membrane protein [Plebeiibacterium marinum]|uniref:Type IX secretion system membrane protein PorP/SprF n=1 Tax=Plebeiibacterium marinum TaxID=2992111 RepID=A0AAE3MG40_9BACT|nr:type IX secretion system membrane protein PorP/SprF [Plebeiobacterium marinum]MCW3806924.1 type IX secretion system membrane protein PorP/SprF [Plebeiobacterium marinum]
MQKIISLKKIFWVSIVLLALCSVKVQAQQEPLYTQYMFNTVSVNPAYAGTRNAMNMLLLSRVQWAGLEGAPRTYNFTMHTPINNYKMGLGFSIVADSYGPVDNTYFNFNYAYRINITEETVLSMGIKGGIYNYHVGLYDLNVGSDSDVSFNGTYEKKFQPNAGMGLYLYGKNWYTGFSIPKLIQTDLTGTQTAASNISDLKRHYFLMAGYVFDVNNDLKFKPSFINKVVEGAPLSTDVTAQLLYKNTYWVGATYRLGDAVAFLANVQLNRQLMVGYSYDFSVSSMASYNNGSHEIIISYDFDGFLNKKVKSPRYF